MVASTEMSDKQMPDDLENADEQSDEQPLVMLDFEKLFKMAEDPDFEDLLRSPLDEALNSIESGNEVQKLTSIRTFPTILESSDGENAIQKMLPAIQKCLKEETSNLDLHCEASVVYKSIIQNSTLVNKFPAITELLLEYILQNIQQQKEHVSREKEKVIIRANVTNQMQHLSAAAWLETIVEIVDKLSLSSIKQLIIPVIQQQSEPVQRVQRRITTIKIIHKLALFLPPNEIRKDLCPIVAILCKDTNSNVRVAIAQRLSVIANALKNSHDVVSTLLPCYIQLLSDEEMNVRESAMNNLTESLLLFTKDAQKHTIFSMIKKLTEEAIDRKNDMLSVIAHHFGKWCWELDDLLDQLDKSWILNTFCKMIHICDEKDEEQNKNVKTLVKRYCCYNYPCMLKMFKKHFDRLSPFIELFCNDPDEEVRVSIAASYHEILILFPYKKEFISPLIELLHSGSSDVIGKIAYNMKIIIPIIYENVKSNPGKITTTQLDRLIIGCNQILRTSSSWRSHEAILKSIQALPNNNQENQDVLIESFIPLLKREILNVRAIPCRITASESLLIIMRQISKEEIRTNIFQFFNQELLENSCCYRRITYIDVAEMVLNIFSRNIFVKYFLDGVLKLTKDPVSNIRIRAMKFLSKIKSKLQLPEDNEILLKLENSVREMLKSDKNSSFRSIINSAAVELSRCETLPNNDMSDKKKINEENELWNENDKKSIKSTSLINGKKKENNEERKESRPSGLRPPSTPSRSVSPWRTERKAIAVVRPQPIITLRSQSPSPMTYRSPSPAPNEKIRKSKLPLSAAAKEKEKLRRAATDTPPPSTKRSTRSTSVVGTNQRSDSMTSSTSSIDSNSPETSNYGLRRSATSSTTFGGSSFTSSSSYSLMQSRSSSNLRRPGYGLSHVSSSSTFERKPSHVSLIVRNV